MLSWTGQNHVAFTLFKEIIVAQDMFCLHLSFAQQIYSDDLGIRT